MGVEEGSGKSGGKGRNDGGREGGNRDVDGDRDGAAGFVGPMGVVRGWVAWGVGWVRGERW